MFRILKREGLVRRIEVPVPASNEYRHKTTTPHQLWATDASYFRVAGWGYYYMVTVMDDFSRFILAWRLQFDMTSPSLIEGGPGCCRLDGHDRRSGRGPDQASL